MSEKNESRDWELSCDNCNGSGYVFVERQVAERKTDVQEFKEECECCEGRGFTIAFEDIPGIEAYVKSCRPAADAPLTSMARAIFGDQIGGQMDAMAGTPAPSAPGDAQDEQPQRNGCGSVSFKLSDGSTVSCDWSAHEWELSIPATRHERDIAFKELLQEIGRLRALGAAPAAGDALDARRYRWLRDQTETDGIAIVMKDKHFDESSTCAENIDKFIDAALAAQVPHKGDAA